MKRGWTRSYRREVEEPSQVWLMPPIYHRVFFYLRQKAAWEARLIPNKAALGTWLAPGSIVTSIEKIASGVSYYDKGDLRTPAKKTILDVLNWLKDHAMITRKSNNKGTLIYINNWHTYQSENRSEHRSEHRSGNRSDYHTDYHTEHRSEHHGEHHGEHRTGNSTEHLLKEVKDVKELLRSLNIHQGGVISSDQKPGDNGDGPKPDQMDIAFKSIWARYPVKDGRAAAMCSFEGSVKTLGDVLDINHALDNYKLHLKKHPRKKIKNGSTWFENWRDWTDWQEPETPEDREKKVDALKAKRKKLIEVEADITLYKERIEWKSPGHEAAVVSLPKAEACKVRLERNIAKLEALTV